MKKPKRGEVWLVEFEPQRGAEIQKTRPAVVLSIREIEKIPIRIVVPIREHKPHHEQILFFITLKPTMENGLLKTSSVIARKPNPLPSKDSLDGLALLQKHKSKKSQQRLAFVLGYNCDFSTLQISCMVAAISGQKSELNELRS